MIILCVDMVGNGAGPGGDTVIDMPADQQEKKSLVWFFSIFERFKQLSARKTKLKAILKTGFYDINFLEIFVAQINFDATYSKIERIYVNQWLGFTASLCILKYPAININASAVKLLVKNHLSDCCHL